jgi:hypothetical protein
MSADWPIEPQAAVLASGVTCFSILLAFALSAMRRSYSVCRLSQDCASPPKYWRSIRRRSYRVLSSSRKRKAGPMSLWRASTTCAAISNCCS